jgi:trehalose 6-phosphate phosphatase
MKAILGREGRAELARYARRRLLVALDYDGTLAPIVARPERAAMPGRTRTALRLLAARYPCVVISGRSRADLLRRLRGLGLRQVIGNHGGEPSPQRRRLRARVRRWHALLASRLRGIGGVEIEDKGLSIAVHYRHATAPARARAAIREAAKGLARARLVGGKMVVNVVPSEAPHKGIALEAQRLRLGCEAALYVGDDETDEDVFSLPAGSRLDVRVGRHVASRARYYLRQQAQLDLLLEALARLREPAARAPGFARRVSSRRAAAGAA